MTALHALTLSLSLIGASLAAASPVAPAPTAPAAAPTLGRLFFTPEARAALERQRQSPASAPQPSHLAEERLRLDGIVQRSAGPTTIWLNQRKHDDTRPPAGLSLQTTRHDPGRATVALDGQPPTDLKVGATLTPASGEIQDALAGGRLEIHRTRQP